MTTTLSAAHDHQQCFPLSLTVESEQAVPCRRGSLMVAKYIVRTELSVLGY